MLRRVNRTFLYSAVASTIIMTELPSFNSNRVTYLPEAEPVLKTAVSRPTGIGLPNEFPITGVPGIATDGLAVTD